ncbi:MAG: hypothetical protein NTU95_08205 [Methanothrix sp.]|nr:hypothetical protein [Methanothrix sp.]
MNAVRTTARAVEEWGLLSLVTSLMEMSAHLRAVIFPSIAYVKT